MPMLFDNLVLQKRNWIKVEETVGAWIAIFIFKAVIYI
jgi:hypothetical protein